jgi:hypothetical protein
LSTSGSSWCGSAVHGDRPSPEAAAPGTPCTGCCFSATAWPVISCLPHTALHGRPSVRSSTAARWLDREGQIECLSGCHLLGRLDDADLAWPRPGDSAVRLRATMVATAAMVHGRLLSGGGLPAAASPFHSGAVSHPAGSSQSARVLMEKDGDRAGVLAALAGLWRRSAGVDSWTTAKSPGRPSQQRGERRPAPGRIGEVDVDLACCHGRNQVNWWRALRPGAGHFHGVVFNPVRFRFPRQVSTRAE